MRCQECNQAEEDMTMELLHLAQTEDYSKLNMRVNL